MKRYVLDTGSASDVINRRNEAHLRAAEASRRGDRVGVAMPVVGELFAGIELSESRNVNRERLARALGRFFIWPFDLAAAEEYGRVFADRRRAGRPMQQIDIQIAAVALSLGGCIVVTKDSDLSAIPRLLVEDWSA